MSTRLAWMRPFTQRVVNPITRRFAGRVPGFAIVHHMGRTSGRAYATPMNVFHHDGAVVMALTYGADVQWVRNVLAAGGCVLEERGRRIRLDRPELLPGAVPRLIPRPVRWFLRLIRVTDVVRLRPAGDP